MKKVFEKIVEGILACSGFVTSLTIVLIVLFLFSEAVGLFNSRVIEEGYVLALNKDNKVNELTPVPPPVTVTRALGFNVIKRSAVCCAMGRTVSLPLMRWP